MQVEARSDGGDVGVERGSTGSPGHVAVPGVVGREDRTRADRRAAARSGRRRIRLRRFLGPGTTAAGLRPLRAAAAAAGANAVAVARTRSRPRCRNLLAPRARRTFSAAAFRAPTRRQATWARAFGLRLCQVTSTVDLALRRRPEFGRGLAAPPLPRARTGAAPAAPREPSFTGARQRRLQARERLDRGRVHALEHGQVDAHEIAEQKQRQHPLETAVAARVDHDRRRPGTLRLLRAQLDPALNAGVLVGIAQEHRRQRRQPRARAPSRRSRCGWPPAARPRRRPSRRSR